MKKALCLALALVLLLSGCGTAAAAAPAVPATATPMPSPTPTPSPSPTAAPTPEPTASPTPEPAYVYHEFVPILMYHEVASPEANDLYLSPDNFQSQLDWLEQNGYTPITMNQLWAHWNEQAPLPDKPIALTFDDGYYSMYYEVFPRLQEKGWRATFYTITGSEDFLTPDMLREMSAAGMEIGSHTVDHLDLTKMDSDGLYWQLSESKRVLEEITGVTVTDFCYPSGAHDDAVVQAVIDCGYRSAVTTVGALASEAYGIYTLPRIRISAGMDGEHLGMTLTNYGVS